MPDRPPLRALVAVGLVAGTTLALQVVITRILSAALAYHFGFLALSLALLGVGVGALAVYLGPHWFAKPLHTLLSRWSVVLAGLLIVVPALLVRLDFATGQSARVTAGFAVTLGLTCVLAALPFAAAGVVIALAVRGWSSSIGRVYAFDLTGAGLGALLIVPLLWIASGPTLFVGLGAVAALAALLFGGGRAAAATAAAAIAALAIAGTTSLYTLPPLTGPEDQEPVTDRWTPLSRVLGFAPQQGSEFALIFYDRIYAPVPVRTGDEIPDWRTLRLGPQSVAYELRPGARALVIGGGGGRDIENALSSGAGQVDVIELNRAIRETVDDDLREHSGAPYSLPKVTATDGDGRSQLAARDTRYDVIHIGFTDTLSAASAQGFALSEANLYTVEAFREYLEHLEPGGIVAVTRLHRLVGDEALRTTVLALEALKEEGVAEPADNVVVLLGRDIFGELFGTVLARREPWTPDELARIAALAGERGEGVAYAPGGPYRLEWAELARANSPRAFCEGYRLDVCPPTDDRPFFFNMKRASDVFSAPPPGYFYAVDPLLVLAVSLAILVGLCALAFGLPLALVKQRPPLTSMTFFAAIGVGFLLFEIALIQRFTLFLGFPTYSLSVVLFALLVFTGLGSLASGRVRLTRTLTAACLLIALAAFALQPLLAALIELPFAARVAVTIALIAPPALLLGTAMPIGLARLHASAIPWAWAINGVSSVLASVLAVAVAITWGFRAVTLLALACYLVALAQALRWRRPRGA
jgi:hypothetical protein